MKMHLKRHIELVIEQKKLKKPTLLQKPQLANAYRRSSGSVRRKCYKKKRLIWYHYQITLYPVELIKSRETTVILKKLKLSHYTPQAFWGEKRYNSYSFSTSALDGEWLASRPGRTFAPGEGSTVPIVQEAGWAPEPVWTQRLEKKILSPLPRIEPRSPSP
jgi:hypothetical protein